MGVLGEDIGVELSFLWWKCWEKVRENLIGGFVWTNNLKSSMQGEYVHPVQGFCRCWNRVLDLGVICNVAVSTPRSIEFSSVHHLHALILGMGSIATLHDPGAKGHLS